MGVANRVTETEQKTICDLFLNKNMSVSQIGKKLKRDSSTIRRVLKNNNVQYNNVNYMTDDELNGIINDYQSGTTAKELSEKYHRSDGYLINLLKEKGIYQYVNLHLSKDEWNYIGKLYALGLNEDIFNQYPQLSLTMLYQKMSEMNIRSGLRNYWSEEDKKIVKDYYDQNGTDYIYELIEHRHTKDAIDTLALKQFGYTKGCRWTEEDDNLFLQSYSNCPISEVLNMFPNRTLESLRNRAKLFGIVSNYRNQTYWTNEENDFLINNWKTMSDVQLSKYIQRDPMSIKDRRNLLGLYRINKEYLGYETIKKLLRARTWNWKQKSMESCNYECVLTKDKNFHIHHLYDFSDIFNRFIDINNITEEKVSSYSFEKLEDMCDKFVQYHDTYPLGVCVCKDLHMKFHTFYGKHNNTPEQWDEFVMLYKQNKI